MRRAMFAVAIVVVSLFSVAALGQAGTCSGMTAGQLTSLNGFVPFPSDNLWNTDISALPVDPNSGNIIKVAFGVANRRATLVENALIIIDL